MKILFWGRYAKALSRNAIILKCLRKNGYEVFEFEPRWSKFGHLEALFKSFPKDIDYIWVGAFRYRDLKVAKKWAKKKNTPIIFDPHMSYYNRKVFEQKKYLPNSPQAEKIRLWEKNQLQTCQKLIADTTLHANYYKETLETTTPTYIIPVGVEEDIFYYEELKNSPTPTVYFYGSGLPLQGIDTIVEAIKIYDGEKINIIFQCIDQEILKEVKKELNQITNNISLTFKGLTSLQEIANTIKKSHLILGIFGDTPQASMVIPNKVFQPLACGRPVITRTSKAYDNINHSDGGLHLITPANPQLLSNKIKQLTQSSWQKEHNQALKIFQQNFSQEIIAQKLREIIK